MSKERKSPNQPEPPSKVEPRTGDRLVTARYSKAKAKDYTDPRHHHTKARGGPITRILPNKNPESASNQD